MKIKTKLILGSLLIALVPAITITSIISWQATQSSHDTLSDVAMEHLISVRENNKNRIEQYFQQINNQVLTFSNDRMIIEAMSRFKASVNDLEVSENSLDISGMKKKLKQYYVNEFGTKYSQRNSDKTIDTGALLNKLDATGAYLQYQYIQKNSHPLGSKNNLNAANDGTEYSQLHGLYHPHINDFLNKFGYYDIFLVDPDSGRIVYSVFKELDYASSLIDGSYANSGLGIAFKRANNSNKTETFLEDFKPYTPSYEDPASFIATPIFDKGKKIGILIFQMPIDAINDIMTSNQRWKESGMGNSGESYIIGSDYKSRSLSRFLIEDKNAYLAALKLSGEPQQVIDTIRAKDTNIGLQSVKSLGAKEAVSGTTSEEIYLDYRNISVLSAYAPLNIKGVKWAILTEIDEEEAFAPAIKLQSEIMTLALSAFAVIALISAILGVAFANMIANPLKKIALAMQNVAEGEADLRRRLDEGNNDEISDIARYFNAFVARIQTVVQDISSTSMQLATATEEVSVTAMQTQENTQNQHQQIEQVAAAMSQMSIAVQNVATNASHAASEAQKGDVETQSGGRVIEKTIEAINQLNTNISNAADSVTKLEHDSQSIGSVLDVIKGIAEQTNLLALNAAIEAARAGEQGRGFAVVADEVRTLASRTQDSTQEIQNMIEKLQQGSGESAIAMNASVELAGDTSSQAHAGTEALHKITQAITTIDNLTAQIASAAEEQTAVAEEINGSISSISASARDTVSSSEEAARTGQEMAKLAHQLAGIVDQFKV